MTRGSQNTRLWHLVLVFFLHKHLCWFSLHVLLGRTFYWVCIFILNSFLNSSFPPALGFSSFCNTSKRHLLFSFSLKLFSMAHDSVVFSFVLSSIYFSSGLRLDLFSIKRLGREILDGRNRKVYREPNLGHCIVRSHFFFLHKVVVSTQS